MLPMFWDETHHALADAAQGWVDRHITPFAEQWEEANIFPVELYKQAGDAGLLGTCYPEEFGGSGGDPFHGLVVAEALVRGGSVGTAMGLGSHAIAVPPILHLGSEAQKKRWVPDVLAGRKITALAITEPGAGSDVAGITTRAVRDGNQYVVNGSKTFITSGARAHLLTTAVRTGGPGHGGISLLVIERDTPGLSLGEPLKKMGWWASDTAEIFFDDCRVPVDNLLGAEGSGFLGIVGNFASERLFISATCVAMARLAIEATAQWVDQRKAFGRPLSGFQVTRHKLAEMRTQEAQARAFTAVVTEKVRRNPDPLAHVRDVAMLKNCAVDACSFVCDAAVQLHGGMGYMRESLVERLYRDARLFPIGGGTTEIMKEIISRPG